MREDNGKGSNFFNRVYEAVKTIPEGKVATYGQIAAVCGAPRAARAVGWALHVNPDDSAIPCFRVVNRNGGLSRAFAFGGVDEHKARLIADGVEVGDDYRVDLSKYRYRFPCEI